MPIFKPDDFLLNILPKKRVLGIDPGTKTLGIAVSNSDLTVASPIFTIQRKKLKRFADKAKIPYPIYLGGAANKKTASVLFPMLNEISSFPTSLFLNEKGEIVFIHTGFNGPGTGDVFKNYKKESEGIIVNLLK